MRVQGLHEYYDIDADHARVIVSEHGSLSNRSVDGDIDFMHPSLTASACLWCLSTKIFAWKADHISTWFFFFELIAACCAYFHDVTVNQLFLMLLFSLSHKGRIDEKHGLKLVETHGLKSGLRSS